MVRIGAGVASTARIELQAADASAQSVAMNARAEKATPALLRDIHDRLLNAFGPQHWWPARTPTEVVIGAILTQNTAWTNVERAIASLRTAGALSFDRLAALPEDKLAQLIRPAGTYRVKARRLRAFVDTLQRDSNSSLQTMLAGPLDAARKRLLAIYGIGPETADAILLYAGRRPTFVVDAYTRRILRRHFLIGGSSSKAKTASSGAAKAQAAHDHNQAADNYSSVRQFFHRHLPADATMFNEYHALLVELAKRHCRVRARCEGCPLADMPHDETR